MSETWYQKAVVYSLDIETFYDGDDDGIGDNPRPVEYLNVYRSFFKG